METKKVTLALALGLMILTLSNCATEMYQDNYTTTIYQRVDTLEMRTTELEKTIVCLKTESDFIKLDGC